MTVSARGYRQMVVAATMLVVLGASAQVHAAALPETAPASPTAAQVDGCGLDANADVRRGQPVTLLCSTTPELARAASDGAGVTAPPIYVPDQCWANVGYQVLASRFQYCRISQPIGIVVTRWTVGQPPQTIGGFTYREYEYAQVAGNSNAWFHQIGMELVSAWGDVNHVKLDQTSGGCSWGTCTQTGLNFPDRGLFSSPLMGTLNMRMDLPFGAAAAASTFLRYRWGSTDLRVLPSPFFQAVSKNVRCDNNSLKLSGFGCVFDEFVPTVEFFMTDPSVESAARHMYEAQASGLPGADPRTSLPNRAPLQRLMDDWAMNQNSNRACPDSYVRPPGNSCDEYPFRSTYHGAATANPGGPGRTNPHWCQIPQLPAGSGPFGYSACMINANHNTTVGSRLSVFYQQNRVMDRDFFYVWIRCC